MAMDDVKQTAQEPATEAEAEAEAVQQPETEVQDQAEEAAEASAEEAKEEKGKKGFFNKKEKPEVLKAKLEAAEKANEELKDQMLRTAAEYDNFRKRSAREQEATFNNGVSFAVEQILPILDTLEMAASAPSSDEAYKKGVEMTLSKASEALKKLNVVEMEALGKPFDPNLMNAVQQVPAEEGQESGSVVRVYQKGYMIGDKVIRHATVVVAE